jgi:SAM-dependent methyltransferase
MNSTSTDQRVTGVWRIPGIRNALRRAYALFPWVVFFALRVAFPLRPGGRSQFLERFAVPYEQAVYLIGRDHWEQKVLTLGLRGCQRALDLGCGSGQWLSLLAKHNVEVVGGDLDRRLIRIAQEGVQGTNNVSLTQMRAETTCFTARSFDLVLCYSVLMYTDADEVMREIERLLIPGGKLVVGLVGAGYYLKHVVEGAKFRDIKAVRYGVGPLLARAIQLMLARRRDSAVTYWTTRRVERLIKQNGFDVVSIRADRKVPDWPDAYLGTRFYFCVEARRRPDA